MSHLMFAALDSVSLEDTRGVDHHSRSRANSSCAEALTSDWTGESESEEGNAFEIFGSYFGDA